jgi:hypothetical protein
MVDSVGSQTIETDEVLESILKETIAKSQVPLALEILSTLKTAGCYSRSGKQLFASDLKVAGPRATIYRVVFALEKAGLIDRESKYSGYFLSHNFANSLEERAEKWRKFSKSP